MIRNKNQFILSYEIRKMKESFESNVHEFGILSNLCENNGLLILLFQSLKVLSIEVVNINLPSWLNSEFVINESCPLNFDKSVNPLDVNLIKFKVESSPDTTHSESISFKDTLIIFFSVVEFDLLWNWII